jgi:hypothetical protein
MTIEAVILGLISWMMVYTVYSTSYKYTNSLTLIQKKNKIISPFVSLKNNVIHNTALEII